MAGDEDDDPPDNGAGSGAGVGGATVPKGQYDDARRRLRKMATENEALRNQVEELTTKAESSETLTRRLADLERERDTEREGRAFDRAVTAAGITDPEGIDIVSMQYGRLPAKDRPKPDEFVAHAISGKDGKGTPAKWITPYLPQATGEGDDGGEEDPPAKEEPKRTVPKANGGKRGAGGGEGAGGGGKPSAAEITSARNAALAGDRGPWEALQKRTGQAPLPKFGE